MAITLRTVTGDVATLLGVDLDHPERVRVIVTSNLEPGQVPIDKTNKKILLGSAVITPTTGGTFSVPGLIDYNTTSGDVSPTGVQYHFEIEYPDEATRTRKTADLGWFNITANADLADLAATSSVPPQYSTDSIIAALIATSSSATNDAIEALVTALIGAGYQPLDSDLTAIAALSTTTYGRGLLTLADAAAARTALGLGTAAVASLDTNTALGSSNTAVPSQAAVKAYADALIAAQDAMVFKGVIDASTNPNYPAGNRGDTYRISVAGKIGGGSGPAVEAGDILLCLTDGATAGTHAATGANWTIIQTNIDGAVVGPASSTTGNLATFGGSSGKVIADSGIAVDTDGALAANSDQRLATQKAVRTYVQAFAQPVDADLSAIAALTTTSFGRALLTTANLAALAGAAGQLTDRVDHTTDANLVAGKLNRVSAASGARAMALPAAVAGQLIAVEKTDNSANLVNINGSLLDGATTLTLAYQYEGAVFLGCADGIWCRIASFRGRNSITNQITAATGVPATLPAAGEILVGRSGSVYAPQAGYPVAWAPSTAYKAYQPVILPTGGLGYATSDRTSGSTWDATERAAWTFIPGNHTEVITASGSWTCPTGISTISALDVLGAGCGGGGGGSSASAAAQTGGPGGACGERRVYRNIAVTPGTSYTATIGAGGNGGAGAAAGGNPGGTATAGAASSLVVGGVTYIAHGGGTGSTTQANSTSTVSGGAPGGIGWGISTGPGMGGTATGTSGGPGIPLAGVAGGSGGAAATSTQGGQGGTARTAVDQQVTARGSGGSGTTSGLNGTTATIPGCGGGGGGGGTGGTGAGGAGGAGARGEITVSF